MKIADQIIRIERLFHEWTLQRKNKIQSAYIAQHENALLLLIVQKKVEHDEDLNDELSDFSFDIANDKCFDLLHIDVIAIPTVSPEAVESFSMEVMNATVEVRRVYG